MQRLPSYIHVTVCGGRVTEGSIEGEERSLAVMMEYYKLKEYPALAGQSSCKFSIALYFFLGS